jgi:hypothetical protein
VAHQEEISPARHHVNPGALAIVLLGLVAGCEGTTTVLPSPRFAQVGELRADVEVPLAGGAGRLEGTLVWTSDGRWVLVERIYYGNVLGEEVTRRSRLNPGELGPEYASLVQQLNETPGLRLLGEVTQGGPATCGEGRARVTFSMVDDFRDEFASWTRCASGSLFTVTPGSAGPDAGAARIVTAVQLTRAFTAGDAERSVFEGSLPFATLDRGHTSGAREPTPRVFASTDGNPPEGWAAFWAAHAGAGAEPPAVNWSTEMVLLATGGRRNEAGHRFRVRRVLPVGAATQIEAVEEVPGDFCAPAALEQYPFHLVRAPRGSLPVDFGEFLLQRIPCGG